MRFFDLHVCLPPLLDPTLLRREFALLTERKDYAQRFVEVTALELPRLVVHSLGRALRRNRFWNRYGAILVPGLPAVSRAVWDLQVPLRLQARGLDVKYAPDPRAQVAASAYLFPAGWSTQLVITLGQPQTLTQVSDIVASILHDTPFQLGAIPRRLSQVFAECAGRWREAIHGCDVQTTLLRARHRVIELLSHEEVPAFGASTSGTFAMSDADRARVHSALLGSTISLPDLIAREKAPNFLCTRFSHGDFALTYFDQGTLLSLSNTVRKGKTQKVADCVASNVAACTSMAYFLAGFLNGAQDLAAAEPRIAALCHGARSALRQLPQTYDNEFCRDLFASHGTLAKLSSDPLPAATAPKEAAGGA